MSKAEKQDKTLYYKRLYLKSEALIVEVKEKSPWDDGEITIYHSPAKWTNDRFKVHLGDAKALDEYIEMLQEFREAYGEQIKEITARKPKTTTNK